MHKLAMSVAGLLAVGAAQSAYADIEDHEGFCIYAAMDSYSKTNVKLNIDNTISVSDSFHGRFGDYNIGAGYFGGVFSISGNFAGMDIDDARMQRITARVEMLLIPLDFAPFIVADIGLAHVSYTDELFDINEMAFTYAAGFGLRARIYDGLSAKATVLYSRARFDFDVMDVETTLRGRRTSVELGLEYVF